MNKSTRKHGEIVNSYTLGFQSSIFAMENSMKTPEKVRPVHRIQSNPFFECLCKKVEKKCLDEYYLQ